jgi:hypothetical protein
MNRNEYLLTQAASECCEVAHRITKALHFGLDEKQAGQDLSNADRVVEEYIDLLGVMAMLEDAGLVAIPRGDELRVRMDAKKAKVERFIVYARETCGTVTGE